MEQPALRPPGPGQEPRPERRPHAAPHRGSGLPTLLFALIAGTVLMLSGVGIGPVGATVTGMGRLADLRRHAGALAHGPSAASASRHSRAPSGVQGSPLSTNAPADGRSNPARAPQRVTLGVEVVDAKAGGALVVGVHVPGPGHAAGLVRGDVLLALDGTRLGSAVDLAKAVAAARPGVAVRLSVRHANGARRRVTVTPGAGV
ncbi:PDZ domain-containing protein [Streptomyces yaanensis]|uniref:PDZ domain-containing protein n=1 Tax=Streptomyces yaanensis TaxID=1142239 RepID=A0ABV7SCH4_9ACTN|nr:PDZ domain-containing protein [Streptomyces sp. CGMCC 4.7035]WNB98519.1 PDZ domain-containing protein [Streptomyces sp. CGMCC 4.7035]